MNERRMHGPRLRCRAAARRCGRGMVEMPIAAKRRRREPEINQPDLLTGDQAHTSFRAAAVATRKSTRAVEGMTPLERIVNGPRFRKERTAKQPSPRPLSHGREAGRDRARQRFCKSCNHNGPKGN